MRCPHHEQACLGHALGDARQRPEELVHALLLVEASRDGEHALAFEAMSGAERGERGVVRQAGALRDGVRNDAVDADPVGAQGDGELLRDRREAVHVAREPAADRSVAAGTIAEALARDALQPVRGVVAQDSTVLLTAVEARELLVAERHHVVGREHHARARTTSRGQRLIGKVRVHEMAVHDVGPEDVEDALERGAHARVVERDPRPPAHVVIRVQPEHSQPLDFRLPDQRGILHGGCQRRLVALRPQPRRMLVHQPDRRADTRIPEVVQEQDAHAA